MLPAVFFYITRTYPFEHIPAFSLLSFPSTEEESGALVHILDSRFREDDSDLPSESLNFVGDAHSGHNFVLSDRNLGSHRSIASATERRFGFCVINRVSAPFVV